MLTSITFGKDGSAVRHLPADRLPKISTWRHLAHRLFTKCSVNFRAYMPLSICRKQIDVYSSTIVLCYLVVDIINVFLMFALNLDVNSNVSYLKNKLKVQSAMQWPGSVNDPRGVCRPLFNSI